MRTPLVEKQVTDQAAAHGIPEGEVLSTIMLTQPAVKRLIEPDEVASLVAWLVGPDAGMATGSNYVLDGGWTAH